MFWKKGCVICIYMLEVLNPGSVGNSIVRGVTENGYDERINHFPLSDQTQAYNPQRPKEETRSGASPRKSPRYYYQYLPHQVAKGSKYAHRCFDSMISRRNASSIFTAAHKVFAHDKRNPAPPWDRAAMGRMRAVNTAAQADGSNGALRTTADTRQPRLTYA